MPSNTTTPALASDEYKQQITALAALKNVMNYPGVTGDGVTDDTAAIQAVLDLGGTITFTAGTYIVSRVNPGTIDYCLNVTVPGSHIILMEGSDIKLADNELVNVSDSAIVLQISAGNVNVSGVGSVNGNRQGQTDITTGNAKRVVVEVVGQIDSVHVRDISILNSSFQSLEFQGANISQRLTNASSTGVRIVSGAEGITHHWVDGFTCIGNNLAGYKTATNGQDGIESSHCTDGIITGNRVSGFRASAFDIGNVSRNIVIEGNQAKDCGNGCSVGHNTLTEQISGNVTATSVDLVDGAAPFIAAGHVGYRIKNLTDGSEGIATSNTTTTIVAILYGGTSNTWTSGDSYIIDLISADIVVASNNFEDMDANNTASIQINPFTGADRVTIVGNSIKNTIGSPQHGIDIKVGRGHIVANNTIENVTANTNGIISRAPDAQITGNYIYNTGLSGIRLLAGSDNNLVTGNKIEKSNGASGIEIVSNNNKVSGNELPTESIVDTGTSNIITDNNALAIDVTGATTPINQINVIAGVWTP